MGRTLATAPMRSLAQRKTSKTLLCDINATCVATKRPSSAYMHSTLEKKVSIFRIVGKPRLGMMKCNKYMSCQIKHECTWAKLGSHTRKDTQECLYLEHGQLSDERSAICMLLAKCGNCVNEDCDGAPPEPKKQ